MNAEIRVETGGVVRAVRREVAALLRRFAEREAGPVGERLRQIAEVVDGS